MFESKTFSFILLGIKQKGYELCISRGDVLDFSSKPVVLCAVSTVYIASLFCKCYSFLWIFLLFIYYFS